MSRRKPRRGEYVCTCGAYRFPHRFGGGRCSGYFIAVEQWESHYGTGDCRHCNCLMSALNVLRGNTEGEPKTG